MSRITNRRWAQSAFGTASSAALIGRRHRLQRHAAVPPVRLMMSIGGAIAGGARLAMASAFDPSTFWEEVRRYGVTVASYTWTMLARARRGAAAAGRAPPPGAAVHRLGDAARAVAAGRAALRTRPACSSSTPRPRPARSSSTCATPSPARWAARCPAAPRCGSPPTTSRPGSWCSARTGSCSECGADEVGMLLARGRARRRRLSDDAAARRVRARRRVAGDRRPVPARRRRRLLAASTASRDVIHTADGPVFTAPIRDALGDLPAVDLARRLRRAPAAARRTSSRSPR